MGTSLDNSSAVNARARRRAKEWLLTPEISHPPEMLAIATPTLTPNAVQFWQRRAPFSPNDGCLSAKGDLLSIATQGLLLDPGPLTSWP